MAHVKMVDALRQALIEEMERDEHVVLLGEDIGILGGAYGVTQGLMERFGEARVMDAPISENVILGAGVGMAMTGYRPVLEIQFNDFLTCGMDQICNQAAKMRFMMGGQVKVPLVVRAPIGATGRAAQHSQCLEAWFMHTPGIKICMPSTPYDAKGLLISAIRDDNPVMFFEHKLLYGGGSSGGTAQTATDQLGTEFAPAPDMDYAVPFGEAVVRRQGNDVTIVATALMVHRAMEAARGLASEGIECEVIDPRTLVPFDLKTVLMSVQKTGKLVVVSEDEMSCGVAAEIVARVAEHAIYYIDAPIVRVCVEDTPIPFAPVCESAVIPNVQRIMDAVKRVL